MNWTNNCFETVSTCLYCGSAESDASVSGVEDIFFAAVPGAFDFRTCHDCHSLFLARRPRAEYLPHAYAGYYTHEEGVQTGAENRGIGKRISNGYRKARYGGSRALGDLISAAIYTMFPRKKLEADVQHRFLPVHKAKILDYGCGNGNFLRLAAGYGHQVVGLDFDEKALEAVRRQGVEAFTPAGFTEQTEYRDFDVVTLAHVIEHIDDPAKLLADINGMMANGGSLFVEVPNANADGLKIFGKYWRGLEAPRHFSLPTLQGLTHALEQAGFGDIKFHPRASARSWMFRDSLQSAPQSQQMRLSDAVNADDGGANLLENAEFITLTATKVRNLA